MDEERKTRPVNNEHIGRAVREVRKQRGMSLQDLADELGKLGFSITNSAVSKLETNRRTITAEDLVLLAVALDVTPNRLLLGSLDEEEKVSIGEDSVSKHQAWAWACGDEPLPAGSTEASGKSWQERLDEANRSIRFQQDNRPHDAPLDVPAREQFRLMKTEAGRKFTESAEGLIRQGMDSHILRDQIQTIRIFIDGERAGKDGTNE